MTNRGKLEVTLQDIQAAKVELHRYLTPTPLLKNSWISEALGCEVYLKLETAQPIGSFKIRGATYKISQLTDAQKQKGVIAASAGNHAQGVAWGARQLGVHAMIVMPTIAPLVKCQNTKALGADVILRGANYDEAYAAALELAEKTGRVFVHAFDDEAVIAGQGTVALEIHDQLPSADVVIGAIGGGGLMAGVAIALKALQPSVQVIGCQSAGAASMIRAIESKKIVPLSTIETFADGIAVKTANERLYRILESQLDCFLEVPDDAIAAAVLTLLEKSKTVAEGAGAVALAGLDLIRDQVQGKKVVVIVSGGNIDVNLLARIIDVGLVKSGRRVRVNVVVQDRPGTLAQLTDLIAKEGANILQAIHDRNEPFTRIDQAEVALTLETRGHEHTQHLIETLQKKVLKVEVHSI